MTVPVHRVHELEAFSEEINATIPNAWLFPARGNVKGFLGTGAVMIVAERPSSATFGGPSDRFLYDVLERLGIPDSHLMDIIKSRSKVREPHPKDMAPHRSIFDREMEIVHPRLIIALGQKVYDLLRFSFAKEEVKIGQAIHYSYARFGADKRSKFEEQIKKALGI